MTRGRVMLGAALWISTVQFFAVEAIVGSRWTDPSYNYRINTISSLGVTKCQNQGSLYICSPWHTAANTSCVIAGFCILIGALLLAQAFPRDAAGRAGAWLYAASGAGLAVVGLDPDNLRGNLHAVGAITSLVGGDLALILVGISLLRAGRWRQVAAIGLVLGAAGLVALPLMLVFQSSAEGVLERVAAYPIVAFYTVYGVATARSVRVPARVKLPQLGERGGGRQRVSQDS